MSLLGSIIGAVTGNKGGLASLLPLLLGNDSPLGGVSGLVEKFNEQGLGDVVSSWLGQGENLPVSGEQIKSVLGEDVVKTASEKLGTGESDTLETLKNALPNVIDKLTPDGELPTDGFGLDDIMSIAKKFL